MQNNSKSFETRKCSEKNLRIVDLLLHGGGTSSTFEPLYYWYSVWGRVDGGGLITGRKFLLADGWAYNRGGL